MNFIPDDRPKILIADDDHRCRQMIQMSLEELGYSVVTAGDGIEALEKLRNTPSITVVITDIIMPGKEGIGLICSIRSEFDHIRIIAITGSSHFKSIFSLAHDFGADITLKKPFKIAHLCEMLKDLTTENKILAFPPAE
ncbi:MAG: response regulator [Chitinispirillaceae bacterium]|nr:response regulator [Chitinispirillaceae bacterium]